MESHTFIVFTGLPASGKTTLAAKIAREIHFEHLDKDTFLDALFDREECRTAEQRQELSRSADEMFRARAMSKTQAVLSSWWRHPTAVSESGTPVDWLRQAGTNLVEVYCECPAGVAVNRFTARRRHPKHLDALRTPEALLALFAQAERQGPIFPDLAVVCDTRSEMSVGRFEELVCVVRHQIAVANVLEPVAKL
jgi:predicted kinase